MLAKNYLPAYFERIIIRKAVGMVSYGHRKIIKDYSRHPRG